MSHHRSPPEIFQHSPVPLPNFPVNFHVHQEAASPHMEVHVKVSRSQTIPVLLTLKDLGIVLQLSPRTIRRLVRAGRLPGPVQLQSRPRWNADEVRRWLERGSVYSTGSNSSRAPATSPGATKRPASARASETTG